MGRLDIVSNQIWSYFIDHWQPPDVLKRKLELREILHEPVAKIFPKCGVYIVGSSLNGFGSKDSDMDICLMLTCKEIDQRTDGVQILTLVEESFRKLPLVKSQKLIEAKVPILRVTFNPPYDDITVDLNANNPVGIKNTHMLYYYAHWDWRVRPLVLVVKEWARKQSINDAMRSTLSSYSLVLMVIHYLQYGANQALLPSLQKLYPNKFHFRIDVRHLNINEYLDPPPQFLFRMMNHQSLADLFLGFLDYYAFRFNYDDDAISVRLGAKVPRSVVMSSNSPHNHPSQWKCICIEEPFTLSNTARSVYDERIFDGMKAIFAKSSQTLRKQKDLYSVLVPLGD